MTSKPLFHVERGEYDIPIHQHDTFTNQIPAGWGRRQLGQQSPPVVRRKATLGQHDPWRHGRYQIIEVKVRGKPILRYLTSEQIRDIGHIDGIAGNGSACVYTSTTPPEEGHGYKGQVR